MNCAEVQRELSDYTANFLPAKGRQRLDTHLIGCESCRRALRELLATDCLVTSDRRETRESFVGRVMEGVREADILRKWFWISFLESLGPTVGAVVLFSVIPLAMHQQVAAWRKVAVDWGETWNLLRQPDLANARLLVISLVIGSLAWLTERVMKLLT